MNEHNCEKTKEKGKVILGHYDNTNNKKVYYCHYCGEEVSEQEYFENLEKRFKSIQSERDRYREALLSIVNYDDGLVRMHEEVGELVTIYEGIAQSALREETK